MKRISVPLLLALFLLLSGCGRVQSGPEQMAPLWRQLYGEAAVVRLPGRDAYALLHPTTGVALQDYGLIELTASDDPRWAEAYKGESASLTVKEGRYRPGDTVTLLLENHTDHTLTYGDEYLLEYETSEGWYPLFCARIRWSDLIEYSIMAGGRIELELSAGRLRYSAGRILRYNAETGNYERFLDRERDIRLIPGRYRYLLSVNGQNETMHLTCEFTIEK